WSQIEPTPEALGKLRGNRHVELSGDEPGAGETSGKDDPAAAPKAAAKPPKPKAAPSGSDAERDAVIAELQELGVEPKEGADLRVLKRALGKARKAHAAANGG